MLLGMFSAKGVLRREFKRAYKNRARKPLLASGG
jgi:hypothetical protein